MIDALRSEKTQKWFIPTVITAAFLLFVGIRYGFWFAHNDDVIMNSILSGGYSGQPDFHNVYMSAILGAVFAFLFRITNVIPWYGLFLVGSMYLALWLCCHKICTLTRKLWLRISGCVCFTALFCGLFFYWMVYGQYTIVASVYACVAIFYVLLDDTSADEERSDHESRNHALSDGAASDDLPPDGQRTADKIRWKSLFLPLLFFLLSSLIRSNVGVMQLLFLGIACAYKILWTGEEKPGGLRLLLLIASVVCFIAWVVIFKTALLLCCAALLCLYLLVWLVQNLRSRWKVILKYGVLLAAAAAIVLVCHFLTGLGHGSEEWTEYTAYNAYRTDLYDFYGLPYYGTNQDLYESLGLTERDYLLLDNYDLAFSDRLNADTLQGLAGAVQPDQTYRKSNVLNALREVLLKFQDEPLQPFDNLLFVMFLAAAFVCLLGGSIEALCHLQFLAFGHIACWFYLYWTNRAPEQVTNGIYLAEVLILVGVCVLQARKIRFKQPRQLLCAGLALGIVYFGATAVQTVANFTDTYLQQQENNQLWDALRDYCLENTEHLYFLDTYSLIGTGPEKIFDEHRTEVQNYALTGGWPAKTPLYVEKLRYYGVGDSFTEALEAGETLYYICDAEQTAEEIRQYICDEDISVDIQKVDSIYVDSEEVLAVFTIAGEDLP